MRHPDLDYMIVMERRREELAEAAQSRLLKEARLNEKAHEAPIQPLRTELAGAPVAQNQLAVTYRRWDGLVLFLARLLSFMGSHMMNWSCRLQYRYAALTSGPTDQQPSPCA